MPPSIITRQRSRNESIVTIAVDEKFLAGIEITSVGSQRHQSISRHCQPFARCHGRAATEPKTSMMCSAAGILGGAAAKANTLGKVV
jgi:hypothetical protein